MAQPVALPKLEVTPEIQAKEAERDQFMGGFNERLGGLTEQKDQAIGAMRQEFDKPLPTPYKAPPQPTYTQPRMDPQVAVNFGAIATAAAALMGLRTRAPLTAALSAAGAAMKGFQGGYYTQVQSDINTYRTKLLEWQQLADKQHKEYEAIITDAKLSRAQKEAMWRATATAYNDEVTKGMLRAGQYREAIDHLYKVQHWNQQVSQKGVELGIQIEENARNRGQAAQLARERMATDLSLAGMRQNVAATPFQRELDKQAAKDLAETMQSQPKIAEQESLAREGLDALMRYGRESPGGTGPIATAGGLKRYVSEDTQRLEALFRTINLKAMMATFQGMSRAIDTQAERAAWERTQPGLALDDEVNARILLGTIALSKKAQAEAQARQQHLQQGGSLLNYSSPILGKQTVLWDKDQQAHLVPITEVGKLKQQGLLDTDQMSQFMLQGVRGMEQKSNSGWNNTKEQRYQELLRKRNASQ